MAPQGWQSVKCLVLSLGSTKGLGELRIRITDVDVATFRGNETWRIAIKPGDGDGGSLIRAKLCASLSLV